jgi:hypothetical protein
MATYGSTTGVSALTPASYMTGQSNAPTDAQVTTWLAQGYATINRALATAGYSVPVGASAAIYDELAALNNLYAGAYVLRSRGLDVMAGDEESRSEVWLRQFERQLAALAESNLSALGVTTVTGGEAQRRRIRSMQMRRIDGYSGTYEDAETAYDYPSE